MRLNYFIIAALLLVATGSVSGQNLASLPSPLEAKPGDICAFSGRVTSVDQSSRTLVLSLGTRFLFHVPTSTPIAFRKGSATDFDSIIAGSMVEVVGRRESNDWTATKVTLPTPGVHLANTDQGPSFLGEEFSVKPPAGKVVSGLEAQRYVLYAPPEQLVNRGIDLGNHSGSFLLSVRPDGTVADVKVLRSLSVREQEERAIGRLSRIKFRPNSVTEARVPISSFTFRTRLVVSLRSGISSAF